MGDQFVNPVDQQIQTLIPLERSPYSCFFGGGGGGGSSIASKTALRGGRRHNPRTGGPRGRGDERGKLRELVQVHRDVFALTDAELRRTSLVTHRIDTGDTGPIKIPPYRASPAKLPIIRVEDSSML